MFGCKQKEQDMQTLFNNNNNNNISDIEGGKKHNKNSISMHRES